MRPCPICARALGDDEDIPEVVPRSEAEALAEALTIATQFVPFSPPGLRGVREVIHDALAEYRARHPKETSCGAGGLGCLPARGDAMSDKEREYTLRTNPDHSNGYLNLSVHQCTICAALVVEDFMPEHTAWHERLERDA
jgi:hypothetical protein